MYNLLNRYETPFRYDLHNSYIIHNTFDSINKCGVLTIRA